jgi:hypothetical protein
MGMNGKRRQWTGERPDVSGLSVKKMILRQQSSAAIEWENRQGGGEMGERRGQTDRGSELLHPLSLSNACAVSVESKQHAGKRADT